MGDGPQEARRNYRLMGLQPHCADDELSLRYRQLALEWHPDRHAANESEQAVAQAKFKEIASAYEKLLEYRKLYGGQSEPSGSSAGSAGGGSSSSYRYSRGGSASSAGGSSGGSSTDGDWRDYGRSEFGYAGDPRAGEPNSWRGANNEFGYNKSHAHQRSNFKFTADHGRGFTKPTGQTHKAQPIDIQYSKTEMRVRTVSVAGVFFVGVYAFLSVFVWDSFGNHRRRIHRPPSTNVAEKVAAGTPPVGVGVRTTQRRVTVLRRLSQLVQVAHGHVIPEAI